MNKISIMKPLLVSAMLLLSVTHWALVRSMREALM